MSRASVLHTSSSLRDCLLAALLPAFAVNACQANDAATEPNDTSADTSDDDGTVTAAGQGSGPSAVIGTEQGGFQPTQNHAGQSSGDSGSGLGGRGNGGESSEPSGGACGEGSTMGECSRCLSAHCCSEWQGCEAHDECRACRECLDSRMDLGGCVVMNLCDITPNVTADMLRCGLDECVTECGFD
jgi:hypothetical protein